MQAGVCLQLLFNNASWKSYNKSYSGGRLSMPSWHRLHSAKTEKIRHPAIFLFLMPL